MSVTLNESELPVSLDVTAAVEAAYGAEAATAATQLARGLPVLFECDKELAPYLFMNVRAHPIEIRLEVSAAQRRQERSVVDFRTLEQLCCQRFAERVIGKISK